MAQLEVNNTGGVDQPAGVSGLQGPDQLAAGPLLCPGPSPLSPVLGTLSPLSSLPGRISSHYSLGIISTITTYTGSSVSSHTRELAISVLGSHQMASEQKAFFHNYTKKRVLELILLRVFFLTFFYLRSFNPLNTNPHFLGDTLYYNATYKDMTI